MSKIIAQSKKFITSGVGKVRRSKKNSGDAPARITNETVAEAREDVLGSARKLIYPLTHSKHKVLTISTIIIVGSFIAFFSVMSYLLYRAKNTSDFTYNVTRILPFPIARVGSSFVPYENYLFEIKRYIYYYDNVESVDFSDPAFKPQLDDQKQKVLDRVVDLAYVKKIARLEGITVSDEEVDARIELLKEQNRLGNNDKVFEDTLQDFYNWSVSDFRRSIRNDILTSKVLATIDLEARSKANAALDELKGGADFGATAAKYSDDLQTKDAGGEIPGFISPKDRNTPSEQASVAATLAPGEISEVINLGYGLEIIKKLEDKDGTYRAAHILITFKPIGDALADQKAKDKATVYIRL
jgi:hypothetical protein